MQSFTTKLIDTLWHAGLAHIVANECFLLKEGEVEKNVYYIESGAVRVFLLSEYEELTIRFGYEGSVINSLASFIKDTHRSFT